MRLLSLVFCLLVGAAHSFVVAMDVLVSEEDPVVTRRFIVLQANDRMPVGPKRSKMLTEEKRVVPEERQLLVTKEWTEDVGSNPKECKICELKYTKKARAKLSLLCDEKNKIQHSFCKECLAAWSHKKQTCPICERPFVLAEVLKQTVPSQVPVVLPEVISQATGVQLPASLYASVKETVLKWLCCVYFIDFAE